MSVRRRIESPDVDLGSLMGLGALLGLAWIQLETHGDAERPVSLTVRDDGPGLPDTEAIRGAV